jgi:coenzyme F420-0:L-glutamate ligase / coenzyme F420-1:gamma-L-glutamate ligase
MSDGELRVLPVAGLPEFTAGMSVGAEIAARAEIAAGDVVVISQKIVSKAEGRIRKLSSVLPGAEARKLAAVLGKEPALVELILEESAEVLRAERGVLIVETRHGFVCANAGIDSSNLPDPDTVCLLPADPDASARHIREEITIALGGDPPTIAVVIGDSFGRAWRLGQAEVAIGCAGLAPLDDWRWTRTGGDPDRRRRRGGVRRRPRARQGQRRAGGDRARPRPPRRPRGRPRRRGPAPPARRGPLPLGP